MRQRHIIITDTDSLTFEIETNNVYSDFYNDKDKFDFSDYLENSKFYDKTNKNVIGKFKDDASLIPITEFIGLRSKMYSYIKDNDQNNKTAKGIKRTSLKNYTIVYTFVGKNCVTFDWLKITGKVPNNEIIKSCFQYLFPLLELKIFMLRLNKIRN